MESAFYENICQGFLPLLFFLRKTMVYKKKFFIEKNCSSADYVKIIELLYMLPTHDFACQLSR